MHRREFRLTLFKRWRWPLRKPKSGVVPIRQTRLARPMFGQLEPRLVLNATAELTALGELLITGTDAAETVSLSIDTSGGLQLHDGANEAIEIANHPGVSTTPLNPNLVTSGKIRFDLGGGDDRIDLQIPSDLSIEIVASDGFDSTEISSVDPLSATSNRSIEIESETITVGHPNSQTVIDLGMGRLNLNGQLVVAGDVTFVSSTNIDFSNAIVTADQPNAILRFAINDADLTLGTFDASGGQAVNDVQIASASSVQFGAAANDSTSFTIFGNLSVRDISDDVRINSAIKSDSVLISTEGDLFVDQSINTFGGNVDLISQDTLSITDHVSTASPDRFGSIRLTANLNQLSDATLTSSGGTITVSGQVAVDGQVLVDSGNQQSADLGGRILFLDSIVSSDGENDSLVLDSRGVRVGGTVRLQGDVGRTDAVPNGSDLSSLSIDAGTDTGQIETQSISVTGGDLKLSADSIRMIGGIYQTRESGDIVIDGRLRLPIGLSQITSASNTTFTGQVVGQSLTEKFTVSGSRDVHFQDSISIVKDVQVTTGNLLTVDGPILISGDLDLSADTIHLVGDVDTTVDNANGKVSLKSLTLVDVDGSIFVGTGVIHVDGGGGTIDTTAARLQSDSALNAITFENASRVKLGDTIAVEGRLVLGVDKNIRGRIDQAPGTFVTVNRLQTSNTGEIELTNMQNDFITLENIDFDGSVRIFDSVGTVRLVDIRSANGGIFITANHDIFAEQVESLETGPIELRAQGDVHINGELKTANGQILIEAGGSITVVDLSVDDDNEARTSDPELIAGGELGRIELVATESITLSDDVQLQASKITQLFAAPQTSLGQSTPIVTSIVDADRAVLIDAPTLVIGEGVQIDTGMDQGTARLFSPRPIDTDEQLAGVEIDANGLATNPFAFYDPNSITVNILEQALVNDATGILSFDIGQTGERGLTVDIDWGAETRRFQQIDGLSADANTFVGVTLNGQPINPTTASGSGSITVQHFYDSQDDILGSTLNGRAAATAPLEVRFAVRHHESIFVRTETVTQSGVANLIAGGIGSSTDDPTTSVLDSGQASFIIPSLTIPVAFFPVRDVIPELETPTFIGRAETSVALTSTSLETTESTTASTASREEFFQLRALSPNPNGSDLVAPKKLPDDILDGDKIQELFAELPDGAYEIEYVLGDGNERSILKVDVRDGEATLPETELDEGELRLKRLDSIQSEQDTGNAPADAIESNNPSPSQTPEFSTVRSGLESDNDASQVVIASAAMGATIISTTPILRRRRRQIDDDSKRLKRWHRFAENRTE
ncbi:hypothetical protein [Rubripirellula reticaptiva]|uniref:Uncharacterized protein n=1 Tax=Rubripirellula reticaptiva TaxID=2528013 RepID=A0A5C6F3M3_9BACT|nr:hypothetical protein [Rubripirellula reticaptiva]TWU55735.1 hypothetical protein Poly59_20360 [Rubripirellula reticaptiva]